MSFQTSDCDSFGGLVASLTETPEMHRGGDSLYIRYPLKGPYKGSISGISWLLPLRVFVPNFEKVMLMWQAMQLIAEEGSEFEAQKSAFQEGQCIASKK